MGVSRNNWSGGPRSRGRVYPNRAKALAADPGLRHGFRSGLEELNAQHLTNLGVEVQFESLVIPYTVPETHRKYTPDFPLPNGIIVETKGKLEPKDRAKHLFIKLQHPELDIRFVFQRPHDKINKGSPTSYAMWAEKYGFKWASRVIPEAWVKEPGPLRKPEEVLANA